MATTVIASTDTSEDCEHLTAELRRRLRHLSVLLAAAEQPSDREQRIVVLLRARGHLAGTALKLDRLLGGLRQVPEALDDRLTERHTNARIKPIP